MKGLGFSGTAKKRKRVRKSVKRQSLDFGEWGLEKKSRDGLHTPRAFVRMSKERSCERGHL
jgi:hypothetical protein